MTTHLGMPTPSPKRRCAGRPGRSMSAMSPSAAAHRSPSRP